MIIVRFSGTEEQFLCRMPIPNGEFYTGSLFEACCFKSGQAAEYAISSSMGKVSNAIIEQAHQYVSAKYSSLELQILELGFEQINSKNGPGIFFDIYKKGIYFICNKLDLEVPYRSRTVIIKRKCLVSILNREKVDNTFNTIYKGSYIWDSPKEWSWLLKKLRMIYPPTTPIEEALLKEIAAMDSTPEITVLSKMMAV